MRKVMVLSIALLALFALVATAVEPPAAPAVADAPITAAPAAPASLSKLMPQPEFLTPCPSQQLQACWQSCGQQCVARGCSSLGTSCTLENGCGTCRCLCF